MDFDNIGNDMNTRVVFSEPRGMIRWLQLFFAILAVSTLLDFNTSIEVDVVCPPQQIITTTTNPSTTTAQTTSSSTAALETKKLKLSIKYPFDFKEKMINDCKPANPVEFKPYKLDSSPQFFVMTGFISIAFCFGTILMYLLFSSTYDAFPIYPLIDLVITFILFIFWFVACVAFASGLTFLKETNDPSRVTGALCASGLAGECIVTSHPSFKSLNVGLTCGFLSMFLWGAGMWFVYKETHFHTPREPQYGPSLS